MDDTKLIDELQRKVDFHREQWRRYKDAVATLKGKVPRVKRQRGPRTGGLPAQVASLLRTEGKSMTAAEISLRLSKGGKKPSVRDVGISLARYIRAGLLFRRDEEGRYELIKL